MSQVKNSQKSAVFLIHSRPNEIRDFYQKALDQCLVEAESLVDIIPIPHEYNVQEYALITSANAVECLSSHFHSSIIAVGAQTRQVLSDRGFEFDDAKYETINDLHNDMERHKHKNIIHICGLDRSPDALALSDQHNIEALPIYEARLKAECSGALSQMINAPHPLCLVFFSARSAQAFTKVMDCAKLTHNKGRMYAVCMSERVSDSLNYEGFSSVDVACSPDRHSILETIRMKLKQE